MGAVHLASDTNTSGVVCATDSRVLPLAKTDRNDMVTCARCINLMAAAEAHRVTALVARLEDDPPLGTFVSKVAASPDSTLNGDGPCDECGTLENVVWFTDSTLWNNVVRMEGDDPYGFATSRWGRDPILCIACFVAVAEHRGFRPTSWRLMPEWPWRRADGA